MQWLWNIIVNFVRNFFASKAAGLPPAVQEWIKLAMDEAGNIVATVSSDEATGAEKKAKAVSQLVDFMKQHNLDLPGDLEKIVADAVIEGAYLGMKQLNASFLDSLNALLNPTPSK